MIQANDLIALFRQALDEKWGYIWGKSGQVWTQSQQDAATRDMTVRYGQKWVGRRVADCSGLFVWAFKQLGGSIYHGSNTMWNKYCVRQGSVSGTVSIRPGTAVFMVKDGNRHHVGLYVGGGKCIEAKGTQSGVVMSDLSRWDEWGELKDVDLTGMPAEEISVALPLLKKGSTGSAVKELQTALNQLAIFGTLEVDGIFGTATQHAVRSFQAHYGLTVDGIVGAQTWATLQTREPDEDEAKPDEPAEATGWAGMTLEQKVEDLNRRLLGMTGGDSIG